MHSIERELEKTKSFLFDHNSLNTHYSKVWFGATETIEGYFKLLNFENVERVLTVCSSGDHIFNLVNQGIKNIDVFDNNPLTFPYFNLRMAMMLAFSYEDFSSFFRQLSIDVTDVGKEYELYSLFKSFLSSPYDYFFEDLYSFHLKQNRDPSFSSSLLLKMCHNYVPFPVAALKNQYLSNEEEYEKTKSNLKDCTIQFQCCDVFDLPQYFFQSYDKILLSNIVDYLPFSVAVCNTNFHNFIMNNLVPMLKPNGEIMGAYIYHYIDHGHFRGIHFQNNLDTDYSVFYKNYQVIEVATIDDFSLTEYNSRDAVLLYKKER